MRNELGGGDHETFIGLLEASSDLTGLKESTKQNIQQLRGLIIKQPIDPKRGLIEDKILKLLVYGGQQMPGGPSKNWGNKEGIVRIRTTAERRKGIHAE